MDNVQAFIDKLINEQDKTLDDIPDIDLYMDQVIQLFENKYGETKRNEDEKILTKTMINNYAKAKLLFPIKNKKYTKENLILINFIYQMKGALSLKDIGEVLDIIKEKTTEDTSLEKFYKIFHQLSLKNRQSLSEDLTKLTTKVKDEVDEEEEVIEKLLLIATLADMSNLYRRLAEKLVDEVADKN